MISHKHKTIFIHISKCAGSSIESAFGNYPFEVDKPNYETLMGWCPKNKLYLQHATPQQLLDYKYISKSVFEEYTKIIIVRNPWARALSDVLWFRYTDSKNKKDSFKNYIKEDGKYKSLLSRDTPNFRGDHFYKQTDYMSLNGEKIDYDFFIKFENIKNGLSDLEEFYDRKISFNKKHEMKSNKIFKHYSHFYSRKNKKLVEKKYEDDIKMFRYSFKDNRSSSIRLRNNVFSFLNIDIINILKIIR